MALRSVLLRRVPSPLCSRPTEGAGNAGGPPGGGPAKTRAARALKLRGHRPPGRRLSLCTASSYGMTDRCRKPLSNPVARRTDRGSGLTPTIPSARTPAADQAPGARQTDDDHGRLCGGLWNALLVSLWGYGQPTSNLRRARATARRVRSERNPVRRPVVLPVPPTC